ncbi:MAG TPA: M48 family metallopeptidase [Solimonas sp.]
MSRYENPQLPDDVNVGRENPLTEFLRLAAGLALLALVIGAALYFGGSQLARLIPFETERDWVGERLAPGSGLPAAPGNAEIRDYLQALTDRLAAQMDLPAGMTLRAHYVDTEIANAFASLGGHIAVTRGLYRRLPSENALSLVIAHEIAHVRARDPIAGIGGSAALLLVMSLVTGDASALSGAFAGVVQRGYSRRAETAADTRAIDALRRHYGHAGGGTAVFKTFAQLRTAHGGEPPALLSTHPLDAERIARLQQAAAGWDAAAQPLVPLRLVDERP